MKLKHTTMLIQIAKTKMLKFQLLLEDKPMS